MLSVLAVRLGSSLEPPSSAAMKLGVAVCDASVISTVWSELFSSDELELFALSSGSIIEDNETSLPISNMLFSSSSLAYIV